MSALVILQPDARSLGEIADSIREHYGRGMEAQFAIGHDLSEARAQFARNEEYGRWLREQDFPFTTGWGRLLRLAAENEPAVREAFVTQVTNASKPNIKKAVATALGLPDDVPKRKEKPSERAEPWALLVELMESVEALGKSYDANTIAMAVPARRRSTTAKKLRSMGTDLGRVALMIERLEQE